MEELDLPIGSIKQLLLRLSNVESLNLGTMYDGIEAVISRDSSSRKILQKMRRLVIGEVPPQLTSGSDWLSNLASYPLLSSLDLRITRFVSGGTSTLSTIRSLALSNIYPNDLETVRQICNRLPAVETLWIDARNDSYFDFGSILTDLSSAKPSPPLRSLTLLSKSRKIYSGVVFCDAYFLSFTNLSYLYLGFGTDWFRPDVGSALCELPLLATIGFGLDAFLSEDELENLAIGPTRVPSLKKLIVDQVKGKVGWRVMEEGGYEKLHPRHAESRYHIAPDWERPAFDSYHEDVFTAEGMKELIGRLREAGVEIEGTIFEAFRVEEAWQKEKGLCEFLWSAIEEGTRIDAEAEEMYSGDGVGDWLGALQGYDEDL